VRAMQITQCVDRGRSWAAVTDPVEIGVEVQARYPISQIS
jgi:hypothetical protein